MKKTLLTLVFIVVLSLNGCSASVPKETSITTSEEPDTSQDSKDNSSDSDDLADKETEIEKEAKESAATATKITDGDVFDSISAIYKDITLYSTRDNKLNIDINSPYILPSNAPKKFFKIAKEICQSCKLENYYTTVSFSLIINDESIAFFHCSDYEGPDSFNTSVPSTLDEEFETAMNEAYKTNDFFYSHDITAQHEERMKDIADEYGLD